MAPDGLEFTQKNVGPDETDSDADPVMGESDPVTVASGEEDLTIDAGFICGLAIICPDDVTAECEGGINPLDLLPAVTGEAMASSCCTIVFLDYNDTIDPGCGNTFTITRVWTAVDACEQVARCTQTVAVVDTIAPELAGVPGDLEVECPQDIPGATVTAFDTCEGPVPVEFDEQSDGKTCPETITRTWTAMDGCSNMVSATQTIVVNDVTPPVLTNVGEDQTVQCLDDVVAPAPVIAIDNCDGPSRPSSTCSWRAAARQS